MPFDKAFDDVYEFGIKGACEDAGVYCERVDEQIFPGSMLDRIYNQISTADLLVADMTGRNPNVFYEVGYAHALGKNVILLTQRAEDIPFDLKHFPHVVYGGQIKDLRGELSPRVKHFAFEAKKGEVEQFGLEVYIGTASLAKGELTAFLYSLDPQVDLTIFNSSTKTYEADDYSAAVIAPFPWSKTYYRSAVLRHLDLAGTELPDGGYLHRFGVPSRLFPGDFTTMSFGLESTQPQTMAEGEIFSVVIRIFTAIGFCDFPLSLIPVEGPKPYRSLDK